MARMSNQPTASFNLRIAVLLAPLIIASGFLSTKLWAPDQYLTLIEEDTLLEYCQPVLYAIAAMLALTVSYRFWRRSLPVHGVLFGLFASGLLFVALEEISWGQRIFHVETPDYFDRHNYQQEISVHNLLVVQPSLPNLYIMVGAYGGFGWILRRRFARASETDSQQLLHHCVPDWYLSSYFLCVFLVYGLLAYVTRPNPGTFFVWRDQEPAEFLLSLGFALFAAVAVLKQRDALQTSAA